MLFVGVFVVACLAATGRAQYNQTSIDDEVNSLPACGLLCIHNAVAVAGCGGTDYACICGSGKDIIRANAIPCITSTCSTSDALKVQPITVEICVMEATIQNASSISVASVSMARTASTSSTLLTTTAKTSTAASASASPTSHSTSSAAASSANSTPTGSNSTSASSTPIPTLSSKNALSTGAIIGIAVGGGAGAIILLALIGILAFGYRKRGKDLRHLSHLEALSRQNTNTVESHLSHLEALSRRNTNTVESHELDGRSHEPFHPLNGNTIGSVR